MSLLTLAAAVLLVARVIRHGPMLVWHEQFFIDPFNVFLVALTAFVGLTTALFSRPYMRIEEDKGRLSPRRRSRGGWSRRAPGRFPPRRG